MPNSPIENLIQNLGILIVDGNAYMRRLARMMLLNLGARSVMEASDGIAALDVIRDCDPDIVVLEWDVPLLDGMELMRIVRSPGVFPRPNIPIIMLTERAHRSSVREALRAGVHEYLLKPTSPKALQDRLTSIVVKPRPMMQLGENYVPKPRKLEEPNQASGG
jgi:two-component system chemotaxis response regulator CheY